MTHRFNLALRRLQRDSHDKCCICGRLFEEAETAHAGYDASGQPIYVGDCCSSSLAETAARFYWQPRPYDLPPAEAVIWRYMDFAKLVGILKDRALFFARADSLGDRFEGAKGLACRKSVWDTHYLLFFREAIRNPPPGHECTLSDEEVQRQAERLLRELEEEGKDQLRTAYVSCWHESDVESEALWRLYCGPPSTGVAIRTTFGALNESLGNDPDISIGRVRYVDFRRGFAEINGAIYRKRKSLSHEKEVRAVIGSRGGPERGFARPVDLNVLLHSVLISPFAPFWFEAVLKETINRFGLPQDLVRMSELTLDPFF